MPPSVRTTDSVTTSTTLSPPPVQRLSRIPRLSPTRTSSGRTDRATVATSAVASVGVTGLPAPVVVVGKRVQQHKQTLAHRHPPQQRTLLKPSSATSLARHATSTAMNGSAAVDAASGTQGGGGGDEYSLGVQPSDTANSTVYAGDVGLHRRPAPHERRGKDMHPNTDKSSLSRPSRVPRSAPSSSSSCSRSAGGGSLATSARGKRTEMAGSGAAGEGGGAASTSRRVGSKGVATSAS